MTKPLALAIVIPVFNDWESVNQLIPEVISSVSKFDNREIVVFLIDDASTEAHAIDFHEKIKVDNLISVNILKLAQNVGHQAAIIAGLIEVEKSQLFSQVIVMDGDGEDSPEDLHPMLEAIRNEPNKIILAKRKSRSEGAWFACFYWLYKTFFRLLTGDKITYGNFCVIPASHLKQILAKPESRLHFAATICSLNLPSTEVRVNRGKRYFGQSSMNFSKLVLHGFIAIAIYADLVFVRALVMAVSLAFLTLVGSVAVVSTKLFTDLAIPGWATYFLGILLVIFVQAVALCFVSIFLTLNHKLSPAISSREALAGIIQEKITVL